MDLVAADDGDGFIFDETIGFAGEAAGGYEDAFVRMLGGHDSVKFAHYSYAYAEGAVLLALNDDFFAGAVQDHVDTAVGAGTAAFFDVVTFPTERFGNVLFELFPVERFNAVDAGLLLV
jgi:hypothetical protein